MLYLVIGTIVDHRYRFGVEMDESRVDAIIDVFVGSHTDGILNTETKELFEEIYGTAIHDEVMADFMNKIPLMYEHFSSSTHEDVLDDEEITNLMQRLGRVISESSVVQEYSRFFMTR